jgi:dihydroorotate dehydrogenase electron transfer subunit
MTVDVHALVLSNTRLSDDYSVLALEAPAIAAAAAPGQFVMVKPGASHDPLLRRPFSVFELLRDDQGRLTGLTLLNKRVGRGTALLYGLRPGDAVDCLGPLGRPFELAEPPGPAWMVAGGVGLAPFATLAERLLDRGVRPRLFYGARRAADLHGTGTFERLGIEITVATEDGSRGDRGFVTGPLARALETSSARPRVYACGPTPMMRAVAVLCAARGCRCDVSLEQQMGCGLGGCYSCVVRVRDASGPGHFVRSCVNGPVFDASTLAWDEVGH